MFDTDVVAVARLPRLVQQLVEQSPTDGPAEVVDARRVEVIRLLEELKAVAAAAQAQVTAAFAASQRAAQATTGVPRERLGRGIAAQVGLARRESHARAGRYLGWAQILVGELPHTFTALQHGQTTEWRAMLVARETCWLSVEHRATVDAQLGPRLETLGDRQVEAEARRIAYRLDPHGFVARARGKAADRRVTVRPAPDAMARLTAFLPVQQAVACYAALRTHADTVVGAGDPRGRGQVMADTLVQRLTGQASAEAVPVTVHLLMTDVTLFNRRNPTPGRARPDARPADAAGAGADEPAHLQGYGPIPADLARRLLADTPSGTRAWLRRLYTDPRTGRLLTMEADKRRFPTRLREFLVLRDQTCRTPWCDAPIRHADHAVPVEDGGVTSAANGQGLCAACNYAKQAPGWSAHPAPAGTGDHVLVTTPTGHTYTGRPPDPPGSSPPTGAPPGGGPSPAERSLMEHQLSRRVAAA